MRFQGGSGKILTGMPLPEMCAHAAGLSLVAVRSAGALVVFGGYNGKYHNSAQVFRPGEGSPHHSLLLPASLLQTQATGSVLCADGL